MLVFHPELFQAKAIAQEALADAGIWWLAHYTSCDLLHEEFGLEIEGLRSKQMAQAALEVLRRTFPEWKLSCVWYRDYHDARWCVSLCRKQPVYR